MQTDNVTSVGRMDIALDRGVSRYLQEVERAKLYLIERMNQ